MNARQGCRLITAALALSAVMGLAGPVEAMCACGTGTPEAKKRNGGRDGGAQQQGERRPQGEQRQPAPPPVQPQPRRRPLRRQAPPPRPEPRPRPRQRRQAPAAPRRPRHRLRRQAPARRERRRSASEVPRSQPEPTPGQLQIWAHEPELRSTRPPGTGAKGRVRADSRRAGERRVAGSHRKSRGAARARSHRRQATRDPAAQLAEAINSAVAAVVRSIFGTRPLAPTATPAPSPGPSPVLAPRRPPAREPVALKPSPRPGPPPPSLPETERDEDGDGEGLSEFLGKAGLTREVVSEASDKALEKLPDKPKYARLRTFLKDANRWAKGGMDDVPIVPPGVSRGIPKGISAGPAGLVLDIVTNLAEDETLEEAVEDTKRSFVWGLASQVITTFTGPFKLIGGAAYSNAADNYDEWARQNAEAQASDSAYQTRLDRYNSSGSAYTCEEHSSMGLRPEVNRPDCE